VKSPHVSGPRRFKCCRQVGLGPMLGGKRQVERGEFNGNSPNIIDLDNKKTWVLSSTGINIVG